MDVEQLQRELKQINQERHEISSRLRNFDGAGRGRGRGRGRGDVPGQAGRGAWQARQAQPTLPAAPLMPQLKLSSMVVVANPAHAADAPAAPAASAKRRADTDLQEQPDMKQRNRRLFGALMGTLQKFKQEEDRAQGSQAAQRRAEVLSAAERRSREESLRAREAAQQEAQRQRDAQLARQRALQLAADEKRLELYCAHALARRDAEDVYVRTTTQPSVLWRPRVECTAVAALLAAQREASAGWKRRRVEQLDAERAELRNAAAAQGVVPLTVEAIGEVERKEDKLSNGKEEAEVEVEAAQVEEQAGAEAAADAACDSALEEGEVMESERVDESEDEAEEEEEEEQSEEEEEMQLVREEDDDTAPAVPPAEQAGAAPNSS